MYSSLSPATIRWGMPPYDQEVVDRWLGNLRNLIALVAIHNDEIVGHAQIYRFPHKRRKGVGDLLIYIHQDFQHLGLGTQMLTRLLETAKRRKLHKVNLEVAAENESALHLYKRLCFEVEGTSKDSYFGEDKKYHDLLIMGLVL